MKLNNTYYILRHGQAISNVKGICSSWPETFHNPLTVKGKAMIKKVAKKLNGKDVDIIYASPVLRAHETASIVAKALGLLVTTDTRLREIDFGSFNGQPIEKFQGYFKNHSERLHKKVPKGENYSLVRKRMVSFLRDMNKKYKGKTILIVSHQAPLLLLMGFIEGHTIAQSISPLYKVFHEKRITKGELIKIN